MNEPRSVRVCGRDFTPDELAWVRDLVENEPGISRAEIARRLCARVKWYGPGGRPKAMSARVALLRLAERGLVDLPPPRNTNGNGRPYRAASGWTEQPRRPACVRRQVVGSVGELRGLRLGEVQSRQDSARWNAAVS